METVHALQAMAIVGYAAAALGLVTCIVLYFTIPKIIKHILKNKEE